MNKDQMQAAMASAERARSQQEFLDGILERTLFAMPDDELHLTPAATSKIRAAFARYGIDASAELAAIAESQEVAGGTSWRSAVAGAWKRIESLLCAVPLVSVQALSTSVPEARAEANVSLRELLPASPTDTPVKVEVSVSHRRSSETEKTSVIRVRLPTSGVPAAPLVVGVRCNLGQVKFEPVDRNGNCVLVLNGDALAELWICLGDAGQVGWGSASLESA